MFLVVSCKENAIKSEKKQAKEIMTAITLVGKKVEYNYGSYMYHLNFLSENKLHWECIKGDEKGKYADETYSVQRLNNFSFLISWVEQDGLGVSQVLNLKDNTINCFLKIDKEIIPLSGSVKVLN